MSQGSHDPGDHMTISSPTAGRSRRNWWPLLRAAAVAAAVLVPATGWCQVGRKGTAVGYLGALRVGQWIQLEGTLRPGAPAWCTEVRRLAGDFLDDDWFIKGRVESLDPVTQTFAIAGCRIQATAGTIYDNPRGTFRGFSDVRAGMLVEAEGTFLQTRRLLAAEVDDESDEVARDPHLLRKIEVVGRVERVDPRRRTVRVMGIEFQVHDRTKLRSVIE
ncbi:MAG: DUF5666 domain-containing protein [Actinomycetota bacterium]